MFKRTYHRKLLELLWEDKLEHVFTWSIKFLTFRISTLWKMWTVLCFSMAHDSHKLIEGPQSRQREVASDAQKRHCVAINEASLWRVVSKAPSRTFDRTDSWFRSKRPSIETTYGQNDLLPLWPSLFSFAKSLVVESVLFLFTFASNLEIGAKEIVVSMIRYCRFSFIGTAASPSVTRFSLSITAKLDFCPGNHIIFMILNIDLSLDPFPLPGEEVETKRNLLQKKSEQIRYRTSRETKMLIEILTDPSPTEKNLDHKVWL